MPSARRWIARGLDALAVLVVLYAIVQFFVVPKLRQSAAVPAPPVSLVGLDGRPRPLETLRGRVVFLDFWASWCEPCKDSIPLIHRFAQAHPEVTVISVDVGESPKVVRDFLRSHQMTAVAIDEDLTVAHAFGVANFPTMVVIDPQGVQRAKWVGFNPLIEDRMADAERRYGQKKAALIAPAEAAPAKRPLTLVIEDEPNSLNTIRNTPFGWQLGPLTQGYLFLVDEKGQLVPDRALAVPTRANGGISPDGRTITYKIRTGKWSDGAPFDASDVGFTIDALRNPKTAVPDTSAVAAVERWRAPRPDTLEVRLKRPSAPFVTSFLTLGANDPFAILPKHIAGKYESLDRSSLDTDPVGLGPFKLASWKRGERLSFVPNPYYWRGRPASDRIDVAIVPNAQTRLILMRTGMVDLIEVTGFNVDVARNIPGTKVLSTITNVVDYVQFNLRRPILQQERVRQAIAQAIDRQKLARAVYRGTLDPSDHIQFDPDYRSTSSLPSYDPKSAKKKIGRVNTALELAIAGDWRNSANAAVQIAANLTEIGISVKIRSYGQAEFWGPKDRNGVLESARYDVALTSWSPALDPDRSYLFGCAAIPPSGGNSMSFCDRLYDEFESEGASSYEKSARKMSYSAAEKRILSLLPVIPLGFEKRTYATAPFLGFRPNPLGRDFWNAWQLARSG